MDTGYISDTSYIMMVICVLYTRCAHVIYIN